MWFSVLGSGRIRGPEGHLSNRQAAQILREIAHEGLRLIVLAHLSEVNNHETVAFREATTALRKIPVPLEASIMVSRQNEPMGLTRIG